MTPVKAAWTGRVVVAAAAVASLGSLIATLVLLSDHTTVTPYAAASLVQDACAALALTSLIFVLSRGRGGVPRAPAYLATLTVAVCYLVTLTR